MIYIINKIIKLFLFICFIAGALSNLSLFFIFNFSEEFVIALNLLEMIGCIICLFSNKKTMMQFTCFLYLLSIVFSSGGLLFLIMLIITTNFIYLALTIFSLELNFGIDAVKIKIDENSNLTTQEQIDKILEEINNENKKDPK